MLTAVHLDACRTAESRHRTNHDLLKKLEDLSNHVLKLANLANKMSVQDTSFDDTPRPDMWNADTFRILHRYLEFRLYDARDKHSILINPVECGVHKTISLDVVPDSSKKVATPLDFDMCRRRCLLVPSLRTLGALMSALPVVTYKQGQPQGNVTGPQQIKDLLCAEGENHEPSWVDQFVTMMLHPHTTLEQFQQNGRSPDALFTLFESFAVLSYIDDEARIQRYLSRLERGIPSQSHGAVTNGARIDWKVAKEVGRVVTCRCGDFNHSAVCVHVLAWLHTKGVFPFQACLIAPLLHRVVHTEVHMQAY